MGRLYTGKARRASRPPSSTAVQADLWTIRSRRWLGALWIALRGERFAAAVAAAGRGGGSELRGELVGLGASWTQIDARWFFEESVLDAERCRG
jgi:hypothetical protein